MKQVQDILAWPILIVFALLVYIGYFSNIKFTNTADDINQRSVQRSYCNNVELCRDFDKA
jgi:hypothetical protein